MLPSRCFALFLVAIVLGLGSGCRDTGPPSSGGAGALPTVVAAGVRGGPCPTTPISMIAVENQYGSLVSQLGGQCAIVTSIISDPNADPHEFQTDTRVVRTYQDAALVVQNGLGYDDFSDRIIATLARTPAVLTLGTTLGLKAGDNPHIWYNPDFLPRITAAITAALKQASPAAASYFDQQAGAVEAAFQPYRDEVARVKSTYGGTPMGATESIFVYMAQATGLNLITPPKLMDAVSEGTEPSAADVGTMQRQIEGRQVRVLVYNTQTVTNLTTNFQNAARAAGIPVVGVSETMSPPTTTFQDWQVAQLRALRQALGGMQ
jgi:zinc/manganese transport system substrate-binding protein